MSNWPMVNFICLVILLIQIESKSIEAFYDFEESFFFNNHEFFYVHAFGVFVLIEFNYSLVCETFNVFQLSLKFCTCIIMKTLML